jgi:hypothetical protein
MENNKKVAIILSILSIAGVGFYFWKKNRDKKTEESNKNPSSPKQVYTMDKKFVESSDIKSSFDNDFSAYKCSCTGKKIDKNSDEEILEKFKNSCLKNGGSLIEIK